MCIVVFIFFFFQAEDGIRDIGVTGVQTCALPIFSDDYFVQRKLYPNVDFYTGLIYRAMGFPTRMFTVLFALGRLPGWIAQWREVLNGPATKIRRPLPGHTCRPDRPLLPPDQRPNLPPRHGPPRARAGRGA